MYEERRKKKEEKFLFEALVAEVSQKKDEDAFRKLRIEGKTEQLAA